MTAVEHEPEQSPDLFAEGAMGVPEAAKFLGMSRTGVYDLMTSGRLVFSKLGRRRVVPRVALIELLRQGAVGGKAAR
jgi:excisionase family DNA binding protein